jgi:hypothetical protein
VEKIDPTGLDASLALLRALDPPDFKGYYCDLPIDVWYDFRESQHGEEEGITIMGVEFEGCDILSGIEKAGHIDVIEDQAFDHAMQKERMNDGY